MFFELVPSGAPLLTPGDRHAWAARHVSAAKGLFLINFPSCIINLNLITFSLSFVAGLGNGINQLDDAEECVH